MKSINKTFLHETATTYYQGLTEERHLSKYVDFLSRQNEEDKPHFSTEITKVIQRSAKPTVIAVHIDGEVWWVRQEEYDLIKFAVSQMKRNIQLFYVHGSDSPLGTSTSPGSGIDGYEIRIKFN